LLEVEKYNTTVFEMANSIPPVEEERAACTSQREKESMGKYLGN